MPPPLASLLTISAIALVLRWDLRRSPMESRALWLPMLWLLISASRFLSEWFTVIGIPVPGGTLEGGSPIDRLFYICLIVSGVIVLRKRQLSLEQLLGRNRWLVIFLAYSFLAVFWSDYPFIGLKRWIKVIGQPIMVLIVLTEPNPKSAIISIFKRSAIILTPLSILFIKYYPEIGRSFSAWTGEAMNSGVTTNKNLLGASCYLFALFISWHALELLRHQKSIERRHQLLLCAALLMMNGWLLYMANSKTSSVALVVGLVVLFLANNPASRKRLGSILVATTAIIVIAQSAFDVYGSVLRALGRDATLTDRVFLWRELLSMDFNPLLGAGFESFWLGERLEHLWSQERFAFRPNQAHNGYLETYINLGAIGLFLLLALLVTIYFKARKDLDSGNSFGSFRVAFLISAMAYNWTEGAFKTVHFVFLVLYFVAIDYVATPPHRLASTTRLQSAGRFDDRDYEESLPPVGSR